MKLWLIALSAWLGFPLGALVAPVAHAAHPEDAAFEAARSAYEKGDRSRLAKALAGLNSHPLMPWAEYFRLTLQLEAGADTGMADFVAHHAGSHLGEKARGDWLKWLIKQEDWAAARSQYAQLERPDLEARCRGLQVRLQLGEIEALPETIALLGNPASLPEACRTPLGRLASEDKLPADAVWVRLQRHLALGKLKPARVIAGWLPPREAPAWRSIEAIDDHPARYLAKLPAGFADTRSGRALALFAVTRMARTDVRVAAARWSEIEARFPDPERGAGWGWLGYWGALAHLPEATGWFARAADLGAPLDEEQRAWRVRSALRGEDWPQVARAIAAMPAEQVTQPEWVYWQGRAHAALGQRDAALMAYRQLAGQPGFYNLLATEALGQRHALPTRAPAATAEEIAAVQAAYPGLMRGLALIDLGMRLDGIREWNWPLATLTDRQLLAAAELARRHEVIDRAINTADRTRAEHDFQLRFPTPHQALVEPRALAVGLDPAWVYGLMRQESRFIMDAKSSAGAKGLMQLMPATAKWVAKKIGMTGYHPAKVTDMEVNVTLGTHYMKMVMDSLDQHPVLASAAYNAGPGRARKWRAERMLEGAIYAETIPFNETRDYVKKVLANAVHYAAVMGLPQPTLTQRLGTVRPRGFSDGTAEDLP